MVFASVAAFAVGGGLLYVANVTVAVRVAEQGNVGSGPETIAPLWSAENCVVMIGPKVPMGNGWEDGDLRWLDNDGTQRHASIHKGFRLADLAVQRAIVDFCDALDAKGSPMHPEHKLRCAMRDFKDWVQALNWTWPVA